MKNNKGFSLIEILVAMGLIGVLTAIGIPAYKNYRKGANDTVLKADSGNAYKAYHAYNAVNGSFCAGLDTVGLSGLKNSTSYSTDAFVGFNSNPSGCSTTVTDLNHHEGTEPLTRTACTLTGTTFKFAVTNTFEGIKTGFYVSNDNSSPKRGGAYCTKTAGGAVSTPSICHTSQTECEKVANNCKGASPAAKGVWNSTGAICNF